MAISRATATRRHVILARHGITYTNRQGQLAWNKVNDTQAKWEAALRDVCAAENKEVKLPKGVWTDNSLRVWYKKNQTPPSLDTIVYSDVSVADVKGYLHRYRASFINTTNITDNITLPIREESWIHELSQHNNEACNVIKFVSHVFLKSATSENCRDILQELTTEFGIMSPAEFETKYSGIIESTNKFRCFGHMSWKTVLFLEHAGFPLTDKNKPYPPLEDAKKAFKDVVDRPEYEFIKALVNDEAIRQKSIVRKSLEPVPFYKIIKPYWNNVTTRHPIHKHYHRAKDVIAKNNSNRLCASDCPHCALFRRSDAADTTSADGSTSVEQGT